MSSKLFRSIPYVRRAFFASGAAGSPLTGFAAAGQTWLLARAPIFSSGRRRPPCLSGGRIRRPRIRWSLRDPRLGCNVDPPLPPIPPAVLSGSFGTQAAWSRRRTAALSRPSTERAGRTRPGPFPALASSLCSLPPPSESEGKTAWRMLYQYGRSSREHVCHRLAALLRRTSEGGVRDIVATTDGRLAYALSEHGEGIYAYRYPFLSLSFEPGFAVLSSTRTSSRIWPRSASNRSLSRSRSKRGPDDRSIADGRGRAARIGSRHPGRSFKSRRDDAHAGCSS